MQTEATKMEAPAAETPTVEATPAAEPADEQPEAKPQAAAGGLQPGTVALCKMSGHAPWPAMIMREDLISPQALRARRKNCLPVMFFPDRTYAWIAPKSIKPLARHDVQKLLDKADKRKDIAAGYRELLDPPDVESLKYEEDEVAEEEEEEEAEEEQEEDDVAEEEQDQDGGDSDDGEGDEYGRGEEFDDEKPAKRGRRARAAPAARKRRAEAAAKPETPAKKKAANGKASPAAPAVSEEDILKKWEHRKGSILFIRHKIQKALLKKEDEQVSEADIDALDSYYSKLEQIKEIDISLLRATKIGKVMKRVIQLSAIPKDDEFHFRERSRKLIESWQEIMGISADDADDAGKMSPGAAEPPAAPAAPEEAKPDADEPTA